MSTTTTGGPEPMERVSAGPITISALGCGTWSWGNRLLWNYDPSQDEELYQAYEFVRNAGVTIFDTADSYGTLELNGRAEVLLGQFERRYQELLQMQDPKTTTKTTTIASGAAAAALSSWWQNNYNKSSNRTKLKASTNKRRQQQQQQQQQVATKFAPYPWRITPQSFVRAARASLERLEQSKLSIAQLHWSTVNYQPLQERALWEGLADIYDEGLCEAVGVSNYGPQQLRRIATYLQERNVPLATAQIQYSLMTYQTAKEMNQVCDDLGIRLISYSPLCLGLLTGKYNVDNLPRFGNPRRQLFRELLPGAQELLQTVQAMATDYHKTPSQIAINWAVCKDTVPIPGARNLAQAKDNLASVGWRLRPDAVEELDRVALRVRKPMIQNIFQTK